MIKGQKSCTGQLVGGSLPDTQPLVKHKRGLMSSPVKTEYSHAPSDFLQSEGAQISKQSVRFIITIVDMKHICTSHAAIVPLQLNHFPYTIIQNIKFNTAVMYLRNVCAGCRSKLQITHQQATSKANCLTNFKKVSQQGHHSCIWHLYRFSVISKCFRISWGISLVKEID